MVLGLIMYSSDHDLNHELLKPNEQLFNPLIPSIKLQILSLCFHRFLTEVVGEAVKISIEFNLSDHVLNSHDLPK